LVSGEVVSYLAKETYGKYRYSQSTQQEQSQGEAKRARKIVKTCTINRKPRGIVPLLAGFGKLAAI